MSEIYVTGHRNPDMDCTVASYCYSFLKNKIDPENSYTPIRCGTLNEQTREAFLRAAIQPPEMMKNLYPKVEDIVKANIHTLTEYDTILEAVRYILEDNISLLPVLGKENEYKGIVSINEISRFMLSQQTGERPSYEFFT